MKILYWTDLFLPHIGGIETFSMDLIPALQARGYDLTVLTSRHEEDLPAMEQMGSICVHRFPTWEALRTNDLKMLISVRRAVTAFKRKLKPDIIHLHFGATSYIHLRTQTDACPPTLTTVHALPERSLLENSLFAKVVRASRAVNAVSRRGHGDLCRAFPDFADQFSFVHYGLGPSERDAVEVIPPSFDEPVILCLGRLTPQKGFDLAVKAFAEVERTIPKARLMIVGEGVEEAALKDLAATLGISDKVNFTGSVPPRDVDEVINKATMVLLPSLFEGLPLVALQAARMQRPIVSSDVDGLSELIIDQQTGLILEDNNEQELAQAILSLMQNPQQAFRMGKAAGKRLEERFGFEDCVSQYEKLYHQVADIK